MPNFDLNIFSNFQYYMEEKLQILKHYIWGEYLLNLNLINRINFMYLQMQFKFHNFEINLQIKNSMNERDIDRKDLQKYKNVLFYMFIAQVIWIVIGNIFFRDFYFITALPIVFWGGFKLYQMPIIQFLVSYRFHTIVKEYEEKETSAKLEMSLSKSINHTFIIPNFKQQIQILRETLENLASHSDSKSYIVFLGMEILEEGAETKAQKLVSQFHDKFKLIWYTIHTLKENEKKGKPSNIDYCARGLKSHLIQKNIKIQQTLIHIMDADSLAPQLYIKEVEKHLKLNYEKKDTFIYHPPQIFARNDTLTSIFVAYIDNYMSSMQCSQLSSLCDLTIGVSNYSISYNLLQKIDFFDTFEYSQTQDIRTTLKAFWKTNGQISCAPIYVPFNQLNLETHQGFIANFKAKVYQLQRHSEAHLQFAYTLSQFIKTKGYSIRKFYVLFSIFEMIFLHVFTFLPVAVILLQQNGLIPKPDIYPNNFLFYINIFMSAPIVINIIQFEFFKMFASKKLYNKERSFSFSLIIISLLGVFLLTFVAFLTIIISFYQVFRNSSMGYEVTVKSSNKKNQQNAKSEQVIVQEKESGSQLFVHSKIL